MLLVPAFKLTDTETGAAGAVKLVPETVTDPLGTPFTL
jgi:hypothetical protein